MAAWMEVQMVGERAPLLAGTMVKTMVVEKAAHLVAMMVSLAVGNSVAC